MAIALEHIRNFCIIAHVDHGKTTLCDRLLESTQTVSQRQMKAQLLDSMDLERERGITIKSHPVSMHYCDEDGTEYLINFIDTPGHVDFSYEVSRSLAACEGALLLIDASQGVEAQTVANALLAIKQGLTLIPVLNKIDLPGADPERVLNQLEETLAIPREEAIPASAKTGVGIPEIFAAILREVPPPRWAEVPQTRALIYDSIFDPYQGVICYTRVFSGSLKRGDVIRMMNEDRRAEVKAVGQFTPQRTPVDELTAGCVGYVMTNLRNVSELKIGDTLTHEADPAAEMLPGYQEVHPMVYSGIYPLDASDYEKLKTALGKLQLNDAAFVYQSETSVGLGFGFRCGFLGLLHMEIIVERLRREYDLDLISTYPSVVYKVEMTDGESLEIDNPDGLPDPASISTISEPTIRATIHLPNEVVGEVLALIADRRGLCDHTETLDAGQLILHATLPLNEILVDFNDRLKSITRGYGSMDYELSDYQEADLVKLDILVNGEPVDAFAGIVHRSKAETKGRALCEKLKDLLPRQLFKVAIQASIGSRVIARETLGAMRKDVTAKCYGGDISRKRKLLEKQKKGKARMKQIGKVAIPQEAFINILKNG